MRRSIRPYAQLNVPYLSWAVDNCGLTKAKIVPLPPFGVSETEVWRTRPGLEHRKFVYVANVDGSQIAAFSAQRSHMHFPYSYECRGSHQGSAGADR